jgi:hypothetical protein
LPDGGGYRISDLYDINPARFGQTNNFVTMARDFGSQAQVWNGMGMTVNARMQNGLLVQGGVDFGALTNDTCEIREKLPETATVNPFCRTEQPSTQFKLLSSYTVPRIDVQLGATFQSLQGPEILANFTATNAIIAPSLGRNLAGNAANVSVNVVEPGTMYGERLNQLDIRAAKILRFGRTKATLNFDVYNVLNVDTVLTVNNAYASWQRPTSMMLARFAKFGLQFDF